MPGDYFFLFFFFLYSSNPNSLFPRCISFHAPHVACFIFIFSIPLTRRLFHLLAAGNQCVSCVATASRPTDPRVAVAQDGTKCELSIRGRCGTRCGGRCVVHCTLKIEKVGETRGGGLSHEPPPASFYGSGRARPSPHSLHCHVSALFGPVPLHAPMQGARIDDWGGN
jgi:hypothetical protein